MTIGGFQHSWRVIDDRGLRSASWDRFRNVIGKLDEVHSGLCALSA
jgi:hypothetical protein